MAYVNFVFPERNSFDVFHFCRQLLLLGKCQWCRFDDVRLRINSEHTTFTADFSSSPCCLGCPCFMPVSVPQPFLWRWLLRALLVNIFGWSIPGSSICVFQSIIPSLLGYNNVFQSIAVQLSCLFCLQIPVHCGIFWSSIDAFGCSRFLSFAWMTVYADVQADAINSNKKNFPPPGPCPCMNLTPLKTRLLLSCWNLYFFMDILLIILSRTYNKQY